MEKKIDFFISGIAMPEWLAERRSSFPSLTLLSPEERVRLTVALAAENVRRKTGGPFAAAVFERKSGRLVAAAVNVVEPSGQSLAHAEMLAIAAAQEAEKTFDLSHCELVSSCEPCVMCFGGTLWSKVTSLVYGAPGEFARSVGFDEGDKVPDWREALERRGIKVRGPLEEEAAREPFELYRSLGGTIY